jgi:flavin reductase (DIM6/NTAB) family NADH-FMN oxidoreductase RutF
VSGELVGPFPTGVDHDEYDQLRRRVLWSFPTGLFVVGSVGQVEGSTRHNLMTANLVVQVATNPKLVAVAVEHEAVTAALIKEGRCFTISLLHRNDRTVVRRFVKPVSEVGLDELGQVATMAGEPVRLAGSGAPILAGALAWVDCRLHTADELGSHMLAIGEVVDAGGLDDPEVTDVLRMEDTRMNYGG